ncbi:MAG TPA: Gfo/Idh/MocA family oxidoreductase [Phycisphaerales bacterium]|nr:Gfo/Idh/MocA family oxidoreductase [Phycisphaerales bacterium]
MPVFDRREFLVQSAGALSAVAILPAFAAAASLAAPLNVAVIGLGRQGRAIIAELQKMESVKVAAVCDSDPTRLESGAKRVQGAASFATHAELIDKAKDVTAVIIATPTHLHKQIAVDLLAAGKHVYCEAPIAHTIEDSAAILAAAKASKAIFQPGLEGRCNPIYKLARTFFRSDSVRDLISMRGQNHQKTSWRVPASDPSREKALNWRLDETVTTGLPGEWGSHQFDVFCWYRDQYPATIRTSGGIFFHKDDRTVADTISTHLTWADGRVATYEATLANSYLGKHEVFSGSNAAIKLAWSHGWMFKEADAPTQGWEVYANRQQFHNDEGITLIANATKLAEQGKLKEGVGMPQSSLYYALEAFVQTVGSGAKQLATAEDGHRAAVLGILAQRSLKEGKEVAVEKELLG